MFRLLQIIFYNEVILRNCFCFGILKHGSSPGILKHGSSPGIIGVLSSHLSYSSTKALGFGTILDMFIAMANVKVFLFCFFFFLW